MASVHRKMFKNYVKQLENEKSVELENEDENNNSASANSKKKSGRRRVVLARLRYKSIASDLVDFLIRYRDWCVLNLGLQFLDLIIK